jgi:formate dehydrogenase subunit gamma
MAARITGAIVAVITAALLIWVIVISFGPEQMVAPTADVSVESTSPPQTATIGQAPSGAAAGPRARATSEQILAARTQLMKFRTQTGNQAFPALAAGNFHLSTDEKTRMTNDKTLANSQKPEKWLADKPGDHLLRDRGDISGISSLPYRNAASFQQPQGRFWRRLHNDQVRYGGGWLVFGTLFALAFFLTVRGRVRLVEGFSGERLLRFDSIERANHWMTATSFVMMAITGVIILYGKPLLIPVIGEPNLGPVAYWSAWLHMGFAVPFVLGIFIMIGIWLLQNLPTWVDWEWLKQGGGVVVPGKHPPAYRFNAGQKILYWLQMLGGFTLLASGITLMFPFYWLGYSGMEAVQLLHVCMALCMIAVILGHIYIGTIGMEGAFDAMWSGNVDRNWAKEHHSIWYERITGQPARPIKPHEQATPAE